MSLWAVAPYVGSNFASFRDVDVRFVSMRQTAQAVIYHLDFGFTCKAHNTKS